MTTTYATITDGITREILPALGEYAADHDVEAIASEVFVYHSTSDLNSRGFVTRPGVDFWATVERHARQ